MIIMKISGDTLPKEKENYLSLNLAAQRPKKVVSDSPGLVARFCYRASEFCF